MGMSGEIRIPISSDADLVPARAQARALALELGFSRTDATLIATAISEIARNIVVHAGQGQIVVRPLYEEGRNGLLVLAEDRGPGIRDLIAASDEGNPRGGLGLGLPGARRLMDDFDITSDPRRGTVVTMKKWRVRSDLELLRDRRSPPTERGA
jgi:serine/threonine-protein kinase RsbT